MGIKIQPKYSSGAKAGPEDPKTRKDVQKWPNKLPKRSPKYNNRWQNGIDNFQENCFSEIDSFQIRQKTRHEGNKNCFERSTYTRTSKSEPNLKVWLNLNLWAHAISAFGMDHGGVAKLPRRTRFPAPFTRLTPRPRQFHWTGPNYMANRCWK